MAPDKSASPSMDGQPTQASGASICSPCSMSATSSCQLVRALRLNPTLEETSPPDFSLDGTKCVVDSPDGHHEITTGIYHVTGCLDGPSNCRCADASTSSCASRHVCPIQQCIASDSLDAMEHDLRTNLRQANDTYVLVTHSYMQGGCVQHLGELWISIGEA